MEKLFRENLKEFWSGAVLGGAACGNLLFAHPFLTGFVGEFLVKTFATGVAAGVSGLFTILATDLYKHKLKNRIFKNKTKENVKDKDEERVA
jgi:hypothetical protein